MSAYLSGAEVIADARLRVQQLSRDQGVLILEGGDDLRSLGRHVRSPAAIIVCGAKWKVLDAYGRVGPGEAERFLFLVDCDYDVPCERLKPTRNLMVTTNADIESDMLDCGLVPHLLRELVPAAAALDSDRLKELADDLMQEARELAVSVGRFRFANARDGLGLNFQDLRLVRIRRAGGVDLQQLGATLQQRSQSDIGIVELVALATAVPPERRLCQGKDLMAALAVVLRARFNVPTDELRALPRLVRAFFDSDALERWPTVRHIRRWEVATARKVLR